MTLAVTLTVEELEALMERAAARALAAATPVGDANDEVLSHRAVAQVSLDDQDTMAARLLLHSRIAMRQCGGKTYVRGQDLQRFQTALSGEIDSRDRKLAAGPPVRTLTDEEVDAETERQETAGEVYFVQSVGGGPIKIGRSLDPSMRLADLQVGSPVPLRILGRMPGGRRLERTLHEVFSAHHSHGEWHHPVRQLLEFIASIPKAAT